MKRWIFAAVALLGLLAIVGWKITQKNAEVAGQAKQRQARATAAIPVAAVAAQTRDIVRTYEAVGSLEAPLSVDLTPRITGRLLSLSVREGDPVTAGQIIARLDTAEIEAQISQKEAARAQAQSRLAEAQTTQGAAGVSVTSEIRRQRTALISASALAAKAVADEASQIAAAQSGVIEAQGKIDAANADIGSAEAAILTAQANLDKANTEEQRQAMLVKEGAAPQQNLDNARTEQRVQEAAVAEAKKRRDSTTAARDSATAAKRALERQVELTRNAANAARLSTRSTVAQTQATLDAALANRSQTPAYQQNLQVLQAAVRAADADLRATQAQSDYAILRAPLTGVVAQRNLDVGALATTNQPILSLQDTRQIWVTLGVPETIYSQLTVGQVAQVTVDALPGATLNGKIERLNPSADPQTRQFTVRIRLDNAKGNLRPGMFAKIRLTTERIADAVTVPREAIKLSDKPGEGSVAVVAGDAAQVRLVTTGAKDDKYVQVVSGLQPGEQVIILSGRDVKDGQKVKVGGQNSGKGGEKGGGQGGRAGA